MRIVAFILSIVVATGLMFGGILLLVLTSPTHLSAWYFVATIAMTLFIYGPLTLGSFRAYWNVSGSDDSRRYYRRLLVVIISLEVLAAVIVVAYAVIDRTGVLIPIVFIGTGAVLTAFALLVGPALFRYDEARRPASTAWVGIDPAQVRKRVVFAAIVFVGVLVLGVIALVVASAQAPHTVTVGELLPFALEFALFASGGVMIFSTLGWNTRLRDVTDRDPARLRRVARVVIRKKKLDLDGPDRVAAARYASVISVTMAFQLAYIVLLYAGILMQQIFTLRNVDGGLSTILIIFLVAVLVLLFPLQIVRIRRARRYAREHVDELDATAAPAAP